jgi:hypothetical protein
MDRGEEISGGLVIAGGDGAELFEFAKEVFDQVACLVEFLVELSRRGSVFLGRDDSGFSSGGEWLDDALVGIVSFVGDHQFGSHLWQQSIGPGEIVGLAWSQEKAQRVAEGVDQSMDLGAQSAFAAAERLILIFFLARRRCVDELARWCCRSLRIRCRHRRPSIQTHAATLPSWPTD